MINARFETAAEKPMFASSFSGRRYLVLADGYYEWRTVGKHKQPYRITTKTGGPFGEPTEFETVEKNPVNFAILTTRPTTQSATSTTGCPSFRRSAARKNGCHPLRQARTSYRPSAPNSSPATPSLPK
jgi:hypothetical protein